MINKMFHFLITFGHMVYVVHLKAVIGVFQSPRLCKYFKSQAQIETSLGLFSQTLESACQ